MTPSLPLIGVIDLRGGRAVHAIAGQRHRYHEVVAADVIPGDAIGLAARYHRLGIRSLYLADLDAIRGGEANLALIVQLSSLTADVLIDAGACATALSASLPDCHARFIFPSECFATAEAWSTAIGRMGAHRALLGLDLRGTQLRTSHDGGIGVEESDSRSLIDTISPWIDRAASVGVRSVVVLDLAFVGTGQGAGTMDVCRRISQRWPKLELISGGGVRDAADVRSLVEAGCDQVLVASALHDDVSAARLSSYRLSGEATGFSA